MKLINTTLLLLGIFGFIVGGCEIKDTIQENAYLKRTLSERTELLNEVSEQLVYEISEKDSLAEVVQMITIDRDEVSVPKSVQTQVIIKEDTAIKTKAAALQVIAEDQKEYIRVLQAKNDSMYFALIKANTLAKEARDSIFVNHERWPIKYNILEEDGWYDIGIWVKPDTAYVDALFNNDIILQHEKQKYGFLNLRRRHIIYGKSLNPYTNTTVIPYIFK